MAGHRILAVIWKNDPFKIILYTCRHLINQTFLSHTSNSRLPPVISLPKSQKSGGILTIHSLSHKRTRNSGCSRSYLLTSQYPPIGNSQGWTFLLVFFFFFFEQFWSLVSQTQRKRKEKNARVPPIGITCSRRGYFRTHLGQVIRHAVFLAQHYFSNKYTLNERK